MPASNLYEIDFYAWTREQASLLRKHKWNQLDLPEQTFSVESPYTLAEILDNSFYPGEASKLVSESE